MFHCATFPPLSASHGRVATRLVPYRAVDLRPSVQYAWLARGYLTRRVTHGTRASKWVLPLAPTVHTRRRSSRSARHSRSPALLQLPAQLEVGTCQYSHISVRAWPLRRVSLVCGFVKMTPRSTAETGRVAVMEVRTKACRRARWPRRHVQCMPRPRRPHQTAGCARQQPARGDCLSALHIIDALSTRLRFMVTLLHELLRNANSFLSAVFYGARPQGLTVHRVSVQLRRARPPTELMQNRGVLPN